MGDFRNIISTALSAAFMAACLGSAQAQTYDVNLKGTVINSRSGELIAGAVITLASNSSIKATSDAQGKFALSGQVVGVRPGTALINSAMTMTSGEIRFRISRETPVTVEVYGLDSRRVKTLVDRKLAHGEYSITAPAAGLPAGIYLVRGRVGSRVSSFKVTSVGINGSVSVFGTSLPMTARLAKSAADVIDTLKIVRDGFASIIKPIAMYKGIYQIDMFPKLPAGDIKIVSERGMTQVNWGLNVDVQVWDGTGKNGTQLRGNFPSAFEGKESWMVKFVPGQSYSAWGFIANLYPEDMTAWAGGAMHLAVKGTVPSLGVTMASANQMAGLSVKVNVAEYGYLPDNEWHEMSIPLSKFEGTDFSQVSVYCGFATPSETDTIPFNTDYFYQVDDIYWKVTK